MRQGAGLNISPQHHGQFARQRHEHHAPHALTLATGALAIPLRQGRLGLISQPKPGNLDQDPSGPAVAGLRDALAPGDRAAVISAWRQAQIGCQVPTRGEGACKYLPRHDGRGGPTDTLKPFKPLTFDLYRRILRIGQVSFLLDCAQLVADHIKAGIFALQFGAQPGGKGVAFGSSQHRKVNPCTPQPWLDVADPLGKEESLDPIDVGGPFLDQPIPLAMRPSGILFLDAQDPDDGADMTVSPVNGHEGVQQRQDIDPIRLDPPRPSVHLKGSGIQNADIDPMSKQKPCQSEPVVPRFKAQNQAVSPKMSKPLQPRQQPGRITS